MKQNDTKQKLAGKNENDAILAPAISPYHMIPMMSQFVQQFGQNYHYNAQYMPPLMGRGTTRPCFRPRAPGWTPEGGGLCFYCKATGQVK